MFGHGARREGVFNPKHMWSLGKFFTKILQRNDDYVYCLANDSRLMGKLKRLVESLNRKLAKKDYALKVELEIEPGKAISQANYIANFKVRNR